MTKIDQFPYGVERLANQFDQFQKVHKKISPFFEGDDAKINEWIGYENPLLGNISPMTMIAHGRHNKLLKFIDDALNSNEKSL